MSKLPRVAGALSFAHLFGIGPMRGKKARAEDEEDEREKGSRAEDDQDDDEDEESDKTDKKSRKAKRAKAGEDAGDDEGDDEDQDEEDDQKDKGKKSKRAKADDDDADAEDDDEEMHGKSAAAGARRRERARCAEIFGSRYASRNPVLAANLAFNTTMTRTQAINVLRDTPAGGNANVNNSRSEKNPELGSGGGEAPGRAATIASRWDRAMSKIPGR